MGMKKLTRFCVISIMCFLFFIVGPGFSKKASARVGDKYIVSLLSNSGWVINKITRKLMFFRYTRKATLWKSNQQVLPPDIDLDNCELIAVGNRGDAVYLYDKSSGIIRFYQPLKDGSLMAFPDINLEVEAN